ncbi:MAG: ATP-binding protein [Hydrogenophaga sp.]|uniref:sensor histidine kinase n=1 Tax=Hydrogenophaga sp. TaxID=1904254 RepID=UPI003D0F4F0A
MSRWPGLVSIPGRWLAPLLLAVFALTAITAGFALQWRDVDRRVTELETRRLLERLGVEQSRLSAQSGLANALLVRRLVGGLGVYSGMLNAYLVDDTGLVVASLARADIGRGLGEVLDRHPELAGLSERNALLLEGRSVKVIRPPGAPYLFGHASIDTGGHLLTVADLSLPLAQRHAGLREQVMREALLLTLLVGLLAVLAHLIWFRRAERLARTLATMGEGQLQVRAGLQGFDELALIGAQADRMAERLQAGQAQLRHINALVDRSPVVVIEWRNETGRPMSYISRSVAQWGYQPDQLLLMDLRYHDLVHPDDIERITAESAAFHERGFDEYRQEYRLRRADGQWAWVDDRTSLTRDAEGKVSSISGVLLDITALKQAQTRLEHHNAELELRVAERTAQLSAANEELEAFSYTVSHDLKAPLRGIDGYSQLLEEEYAERLDDEGRQFIGRIRRGVHQMGALISDLLDYSRMERRTMESQQVDLMPLIELVIEGHGADIRTAGTQLHLKVEPMVLQLDREGLALVLRNLVGNAVKFSKGRSPPVVEIGSRSEAGRRILWVRDNGVGFDMKYHDRIFGIFQRLQRAEDYAGTGVGLALVAKAVQRMGGRVRAESQPGEGATFFLEFPE